MSNIVEYQDLIAFHPGAYVEEIVDDLNITQAEFAERLGVSSKLISKIINGQDNISASSAEKLARLTGISMETWLNLQAQYDAKISEIKDSQDSDEVRIAGFFDFKYLKENRFITNKRYSITDKIKELRKLLKISSLSKLATFNASVSYRRSSLRNEEKSIVCSNAMLDLATERARNITDNKYSRYKLKQSFPTIKQLSLKMPEEFYPILVNLLLECGIVLEVLPMLAGAGLNGATKKFKNGSVLLLVTDRYKYADIFWFTLVHELGHIYYEDFYSDYKNKENYLAKEEKADEFASEFFISQKQFDQFVSKKNFTKESIKTFSDDLNIDPGILVGRLQKNKLIVYSVFNSLRTRYKVVVGS